MCLIYVTHFVKEFKNNRSRVIHVHCKAHNKIIGPLVPAIHPTLDTSHMHMHLHLWYRSLDSSSYFPLSRDDAASAPSPAHNDARFVTGQSLRAVRKSNKKGVREVRPRT